MRKLVILLVLVVAVLIAACAGDQLLSESIGTDQTLAQDERFDLASEAASFATPAAAHAPVVEVSNEGAGGSRGTLQTAQRKVISTASITLRVDVVQTAIEQAQAAVESLGGFVEHLSSSGGPERHQANMTLRVPQDQFSAAVSAIEALGVVQSRNLGTEDVSAQFIDLEARLKSSLREEQSLLSLLERTNTVGEILTIERELFRVRPDIERVQGQLNFLERRVDLATINLTLFPLEDQIATPPSASLAIEVSRLGDKVTGIKGLVASVNGAVDRVFLSISDGRERAELTLRVFTRDFDQVMEFLENQGEVKSKQSTEATGGTGSEATLLEKPEARIVLSLLDDSGAGLNLLTLIGIIVGSVAGGVLVLFLGYRVLLMVQRGRPG